jgi:hypothetical protein
VEVFCGSFQEQPTYLKYSRDLVLLRRGLFSTINYIVTERQVAYFFFFRAETDLVTIVLHFTVGRTSGAFISEVPNSAEQGLRRDRISPPFTGICVRYEHCMLPSVCVCLLEIGFSELFWGYLALR